MKMRVIHSGLLFINRSTSKKMYSLLSSPCRVSPLSFRLLHFLFFFIPVKKTLQEMKQWRRGQKDVMRKGRRQMSKSVFIGVELFSFTLSFSLFQHEVEKQQLWLWMTRGIFFSFLLSSSLLRWVFILRHTKTMFKHLQLRDVRKLNYVRLFTPAAAHSGRRPTAWLRRASKTPNQPLSPSAS